jgi:hypothetical protein
MKIDRGPTSLERNFVSRYLFYIMVTTTGKITFLRNLIGKYGTEVSVYGAVRLWFGEFLLKRSLVVGLPT